MLLKKMLGIEREREESPHEACVRVLDEWKNDSNEEGLGMGEPVT